MVKQFIAKLSWCLLIYYLFILYHKRIPLSLSAISNFDILQYITQRVLHKDYVFVATNSSEFEYIGRWMRSSTDTKSIIGFPGSRIAFVVSNSTDIVISLQQGQVQSSLANRVGSAPSVNGPYTSPRSSIIDSESCEISINVHDFARQSTQFYNSDSGFTRVTVQETHSEPGSSKISIQMGCTDHRSFFDFKGIWIRKGASFTSSSTSGKMFPPISQNIEIVSSVLWPTIKASNPLEMRYPMAQTHKSFMRQLEILDMFESLATFAPIPLSSCITTSCHKSSAQKFQYPRGPTVADHYFQPAQLTLSSQHVPWNQLYLRPPSMLVLEIGYWDFHHYLIDPSHRTVHSIESFTVEFVSTYVKFILTMRRNFPRPQEPESEQRQDESYIYNSLPSTVPIFLVLPPLPSTHDPLVQSTLSEAIHRVINTLRNIEGDIRTIFIDTSGWLDDTDFDHVPIQIPTPSERTQGVEFPFVNKAGHKKVGYFLWLHLCPYLDSSDDNRPSHESFNNTRRLNCPFDKHYSYHGSMYVPEDINMAMALEEKKIARVQALLGRTDGQTD